MAPLAPQAYHPAAHEAAVMTLRALEIDGRVLGRQISRGEEPGRPQDVQPHQSGHDAETGHAR
jgi:hypothetical protein